MSGGCPFGHGSADKVPSASGTGEGIYYNDYLQLDKILSAQDLESKKKGDEAHDEMLFIVIHQVYELWFKQILHDLDSILKLFSRETIPEKTLGTVNQRLGRIITIQKLLVDQVSVLETMTALDFLDFRKHLFPASGFQSIQFRLLENKLGVLEEKRLQYQNIAYTEFFKEDHADKLKASHKESSLFCLVEKWLERTPFLSHTSFDFWEEYCNLVRRNMTEEREMLAQNPHYSEEEKKALLEDLKKTQSTFECLLDEEKYKKLIEKGERRLSYKATQAALLVYLYRDEPVLHMPFIILDRLVEIDRLLTSWRHRHALMVQRMIGVKPGTGGSSGYRYLRATASERYKVFSDISNLSTFLVCRKDLPTLPPTYAKELGFHYEEPSSSS